MTDTLFAIASLPINLNVFGELTEEQFFQLCQDNKILSFEREANGTILIMAPTGDLSSIRNTDIIIELGLWNRRTGLGKLFESNAGFTLPNGAVRSPDAAWIANDRWEQIAPEDREKFGHICPDFVLESASPSDSIIGLQAKMQEYMANGARLGWLVEPKAERLTIYRINGTIEVLQGFDQNALGEDVLPGFVLDLKILR